MIFVSKWWRGGWGVNNSRTRGKLKNSWTGWRFSFKSVFYVGWMSITHYMPWWYPVGVVMCSYRMQTAPCLVFSHCQLKFWISYASLLVVPWCSGYHTVQLHSRKSELRFCAGSISARGVSEICDGANLWQWSWLETKLNAFRQLTIQKQFIISVVCLNEKTIK